MSRLHIITGDREIGKSTLCQHLAELAGAAGWQLGGLLSPALFEAGQKTGIAAVVDSRPLAHHLTQEIGLT